MVSVLALAFACQIYGVPSHSYLVFIWGFIDHVCSQFFNLKYLSTSFRSACRVPLTMMTII